MKRNQIALGVLTAIQPTGLVVADEAEEKAIAAIMKWGGRIQRDEDVAGRPVSEVFLSSTNVTDAGLKVLATFKELWTLHLSSTRVTDAGLPLRARLAGAGRAVAVGWPGGASPHAAGRCAAGGAAGGHRPDETAA